MPKPSPEQLVRAYQTRLLAIRAKAGLIVGKAWTRANVDEAAAQQFITLASTVSVAAQTQTSALVDAYLAAMTAQPPKGINAPVGPAVRNGTETAVVYERAVVEARGKLSDGKTWVDAMRAGGARAVSSAETDVMLSQRQAMVDWAQDSNITGYSRVLTGRSCMFCAEVSGQVYRTDQLMPIHNHCDCGVAPIIGERDPGHAINSDLLDTLKASGGSNHWKDRGLVDIDDQGRFHVANHDGTARVLKVAERQHGELGPVLVDENDHFTGPRGLAA